MRNGLSYLLVLAFIISAISTTFTTPARASNWVDWNASYSPASGNYDKVRLPNSIDQAKTGESIYFNVQVGSDIKLKKINLYIQAPNASSYSFYDCESSGTYIRYAYFPYHVESAPGTLKYYFELIGTNGNTAKTYESTLDVQKASTPQILCPVRNCDETNSAGVDGTTWGYYSSNYRSDNRHWHVGLDLKVKGESYYSTSHNFPDDYVYALTEGTVKSVGYNSANGNYVVIQHTISSKIVYSFYGHLYKYYVQAGDEVDCDTIIGAIGWTGDSPGNGKHVHFAISDTLRDGTYVGYTNVNILKTNTDVASYNGVTFYNPWYVINNKKLP